MCIADFDSSNPQHLKAIIDEMRQRHAEELAAALTTLRIVKIRGEAKSRMLDQAIHKLEAQVAADSILDTEAGFSEDACEALARLAHVLLVSREEWQLKIRVKKFQFQTDPATLRNILAFAYHGLLSAIDMTEGPDPDIVIRLKNYPRRILMAISYGRENHPRPRKDPHADMIAGIVEGLGGSLRSGIFGKREITVASLPFWPFDAGNGGKTK